MSTKYTIDATETAMITVITSETPALLLSKRQFIAYAYLTNIDPLVL